MITPPSMNVRLPRCLLGLVLVLLGVGMPRPVFAEERWKIQGRLLDERGAPVADAPVVASCIGGLPEGPFIDCGFPGLVGRQTRTNAEGRFSLERLPPARYTLYAALEAPGHGITAEVALPIELRQDQVGLDLRLKPRAPAQGDDAKRVFELSGQVTDSKGAPLAHVHVSASPESAADKESGRYRATSVETDDSGHFKVQGLLEGAYRLQVREKGFLFQQALVHTREAPHTFQLKRGGLVRGRVVKPDGTPVEKLRHECREGFLNSLPEGRFELSSEDEGGELRMCFTAPGMSPVRRHFTVPPEQVLDVGEVRMEPARAVKVRVTDRANGAPVLWASITVVGAEPSGHSNVTGEEGQAVLRDIPDAELDLDVTAPNYRVARVHLRPGQTEVALALDPGLVLTGRALDAAGQPDIGTVSASCGEQKSTPVQLDPQGRFRLTGLHEGACTLSFQLLSSPLPTFEYVRWIWLDPRQPLAFEFRAPPKARHPVHLRFQGQGTPRRALLFAEDLPPQTNLTDVLRRVGPVVLPAMVPEVGGWRFVRREEGGLRAEKLGAGHYTLVVELPEGVFRVPLTVGEQEQTVTVEIPTRLLPLPQ
jgi:hypothetical protein